MATQQKFSQVLNHKLLFTDHDLQILQKLLYFGAKYNNTRSMYFKFHDITLRAVLLERVFRLITCIIKFIVLLIARGA